jgi:chloramphenicol O-acetyltransferase
MKNETDKTNTKTQRILNVEHIKCNLCNDAITFNEDLKGNCDHEPFYIIKRSNYAVLINEDYEIELSEENNKMQRYICEKCFLAIIKESKLLRKLVYK